MGLVYLRLMELTFYFSLCLTSVLAISLFMNLDSTSERFLRMADSSGEGWMVDFERCSKWERRLLSEGMGT